MDQLLVPLVVSGLRPSSSKNFQANRSIRSKLKLNPKLNFNQCFAFFYR